MSKVGVDVFKEGFFFSLFYSEDVEPPILNLSARRYHVNDFSVVDFSQSFFFYDVHNVQVEVQGLKGGETYYFFSIR